MEVSFVWKITSTRRKLGKNQILMVGKNYEMKDKIMGLYSFDLDN